VIGIVDTITYYIRLSQQGVSFEVCMSD